MKLSANPFKPACYGSYDPIDSLAISRRDCPSCWCMPGCVALSASPAQRADHRADHRGRVHLGVDWTLPQERRAGNPQASDGSTASYYELPAGATELQDLISYRNMNAQMGEVGRAWYRYGQCPHSPKMRDLKKMKFYIEAEIARLEKYGEGQTA